MTDHSQFDTLGARHELRSGTRLVARKNVKGQQAILLLLLLLYSRTSPRRALSLKLSDTIRRSQVARRVAHGALISHAHPRLNQGAL